MTLAAADIQKIAEDIWHAEQTGEWTEAPSNRFPGITVDDGYAIGTAVRDLKIAAGRSVKGHKFGTSMQPGGVLSGSFVRAVPLDANQSLMALFDGLGEVTLKVME